MTWLNYHHLHYFWATAREGSISRASATLRLSQPTLSAQIKRLEGSLGVTLFERRGRSLVLTDMGRMVFQYADEIFGVGRELLDAVHGRRPGRIRPLAVGVANAVPKLIVHRLLKPVVGGPEPTRLICREENTDALLAQLATHTLDVVITDMVMPGSVDGRELARRLRHEKPALKVMISSGYSSDMAEVVADAEPGARQLADEAAEPNPA